MFKPKIIPTFQSPPIPEEPWLYLPKESDFSAWEESDKVRYNQMNRYQEICRVYRHAFDFIADNSISGDYFEFGCHRVRTFRIALTEARRQNLSQMRFLAFDSFQGMPSPAPGIGNPAFRAGALCTTEQEFMDLAKSLGHSQDRISTFRGFFESSLNDKTRNELLSRGHRIAMATIDCDTYASYKPVIKFIEPFLQTGSIIYMRNLFVGYKGSPKHTPYRALIEMRKSSRLSLEEFISAGFLGKAFLVYDPGA